MCFDFCYSFYLSKKDGKILFSASFFSEAENEHIEFENAPVKEEVLSSLFDLISKNNLFERAKNFKASEENFETLDETAYTLGIFFKSTSVFSRMRSKELEKFFFELAEKHIRIIF